jgi:hypothetical protein
MITREDIRTLALALPQSVEADHHGIPSFRVAGKIFCTVHSDRPRLMVKLHPDDQHNLSEGHPGVVEPVPGYWGRRGSTFVAFEQCDAAFLESVIRLAWSSVAPRRILSAP